MDVNMPDQPTQPPQAYEPPTQPPPPYQPPAAPPAPYTPPAAAQQPYAPPADVQPPYAPQQPVGYQQPGYAPPPPPVQGPRKGFNWLACCGISCLVLLIVGGGIGFCTYRMVKPFIQMLSEMEKVYVAVTSASESEAIGGATPVEAATLLADPATYEGQWLSVEGVVANTSPVGSSFSSGSFNSEDTTPYTLQEGLIVLDTTKAPAVGVAGDTIRAYGQIYSLDLEEMKQLPMIGPIIVEEMKKDPTLQGQLKFAFLLAKKVELVSAGSGAPGAPPAGADGAAPDGTATGGAADAPPSDTAADSGGDGWIK